MNEELQNAVKTLENKIIKEIDTLLISQTGLTRSLTSTIKVKNSQLKEMKESISKCRNTYTANATSLEGQIDDFKKNMAEMLPDKKIKLNEKINSELKKYKDSEREYRSELIKARNVRNEHIAEVEKTLNSFQDMAENRTTGIQQAITSTISLIVESLTKIATNIAKATISSVDPKKDIQSIIDMNLALAGKKVDEVVLLKVPTKYEGIINEYDKFYSSNKSYDFSKNGVVLLNKPSEEESKSYSIQKVLESIWNNANPNDTDKLNLQSSFKTHDGRASFLADLNQYRKNSLFTLKQSGYNLLTQISNAFLDEVYSPMDTEGAFSLMILAQTFYLDPKDAPKESHKDKIYLISSIGDHKIWSSLEFWEKGINLSIKEEILKDNKEKSVNETNDDSKVRQDNIKFGKLGCFVVSMLSFKITSNEVKSFLEKICKDQGLPTDMTKSLQVSK